MYPALLLPFIILLVNSPTIPGLTTVKPCSVGVLPTVILTSLVECTDNPCDVARGYDVTMQLNFTSPKYLDNITPQVIAHLDMGDVPFPLSQTDACEGITNTPCPIVQNERVTYEFSMYIYKLLPEITLGLKFSIMDQKNTVDAGDDEAVVCFSVNLKVT